MAVDAGSNLLTFLAMGIRELLDEVRARRRAGLLPRLDANDIAKLTVAECDLHLAQTREKWEALGPALQEIARASKNGRDFLRRSEVYR